MLRACCALLLAAWAAEAKHAKIGVFMPATMVGTNVYLQSALTGLYAPGIQGYCSANLARDHVNAKNPTVVPTIANLTSNLTIELVHYDSQLRSQNAMPAFLTMKDDEGVDAFITDSSTWSQYVAMYAGAQQVQLPVCASIATDPDLVWPGSYPYLSVMRGTDTAAAAAMCNLVSTYSWAALGLMHSNSAQFNGYGDAIRSYCPTVGVTVVIATTYETFTSTASEADLAASNVTYASAINTLLTATSSGVNIWVHVGFYTAGPVIYELADAAGLLSAANVWINTELITWGDIVRLSDGGYPNNGISQAASLMRLYGMLQLTETYGTEAGWGRYQAAYWSTANTRDDCACSSLGDAGANAAFNHTTWPGGGLSALPGTRAGLWPSATAGPQVGMWGPPHEVSAPVYDCVIALAAAFAATDGGQTGSAWAGSEVMATCNALPAYSFFMRPPRTHPTPRHAMPCHATPCHATRCHAMICQVMANFNALPEFEGASGTIRLDELYLRLHRIFITPPPHPTHPPRPCTQARSASTRRPTARPTRRTSTSREASEPERRPARRCRCPLLLCGTALLHLAGTPSSTGCSAAPASRRPSSRASAPPAPPRSTRSRPPSGAT